MEIATCEAENCRGIATHVYGPACCGEADGLMYLCSAHAKRIGDWLLEHADDQYTCSRHGAGGPVRDAVYLGRA